MAKYTTTDADDNITGSFDSLREALLFEKENSYDIICVGEISLYEACELNEALNKEVEEIVKEIT